MRAVRAAALFGLFVLLVDRLLFVQSRIVVLLGARDALGVSVDVRTLGEVRRKPASEK